MEKVTDPSVLAELNGTSSSGSIKETDPAILAELNGTPQVEGNTSLLHKAANAADYVNAFGSGLRQGAMDATGDMAYLAGNLMKIASNPQQLPEKLLGLNDTNNKTASDKIIESAQDKAGEVYGKFKDYTNSGDIGAQARADHPIVGAVGAGTGYVTTGTALGNTVANPMLKTISPVTSKVFPDTLLGQASRGAVEQGTVGGLMGAGANPDSPGKGFLYGAAVAAPIGFTANYVGYKLQKAQEIIQKVLDNASNAGVQTNNEVIAKIRAELNAHGINIAKEKLVDQVQAEIRTRMGSINGSPMEMIVDRAKGRYPEVKAKTDELYKPLNESTQAGVPSNTLQAIDEAKPNNLELPKQPVSQDSSLKDLMTYRRQIATLETRAYQLARDGKMPVSNAQSYTQIKSAVTSDINNLASKAGLGDQLAQADSYWATNKAPFKVYNDRGELVSEEQVSNAYNKVAALLNSKNPDINKLAQVSDSLGDSGKDLVSKALIENAYQNSLMSSGRINIRMFDTKINQLSRSAAGKKFLTPGNQDLVLGLKRVVAGGRELTTQGLALKNDPGFVERMYQNLIHSDMGILLLQKLGSMSPQTQAYKTILTNLISGTAALGFSREQINQEKNQPQNTQPN